MTSRTHVVALVFVTLMVCLGLLGRHLVETRRLGLTHEKNTAGLKSAQEQARTLKAEAPALYLALLKKGAGLEKKGAQGLAQKAEQLQGRVAQLATLVPEPLKPQTGALQTDAEDLAMLARSLAHAQSVMTPELFVAWKQTLATSRFEEKSNAFAWRLTQLEDALAQLLRHHEAVREAEETRLRYSTLTASAVAAVLLLALGAALGTGRAKAPPPSPAEALAQNPRAATTTPPGVATPPAEEKPPLAALDTGLPPSPAAPPTPPPQQGFLHHEVFPLAEEPVTGEPEIPPPPFPMTDPFTPPPQEAPPTGHWTQETQAQEMDFPQPQDSPGLASFTGLSNFDLQNVTPHDPFYTPAAPPPVMDLTPPAAAADPVPLAAAVSHEETAGANLFFTLSFEPSPEGEKEEASFEVTPEPATRKIPEAEPPQDVFGDMPEPEPAPPAPEAAFEEPPPPPAETEPPTEDGAFVSPHLSREMWQHLSQQQADAVWCVSAQGHGLIYAKGDLPQTLGTTLDLLSQQPMSWLTRLHPQDKPTMAALISSAVARGEPLDLLYRIGPGEGHWRAHHVWPQREEGRLQWVSHAVWKQSATSPAQEEEPAPAALPPAASSDHPPAAHLLWLFMPPHGLGELIKRQLEKEGHVVELFESPPTLPLAITQNTPAVVLVDMDHHPPQKSGWLGEAQEHLPAARWLLLGKNTGEGEWQAPTGAKHLQKPVALAQLKRLLA